MDSSWAPTFPWSLAAFNAAAARVTGQCTSEEAEVAGGSEGSAADIVFTDQEAAAGAEAEMFGCQSLGERQGAPLACDLEPTQAPMAAPEAWLCQTATEAEFSREAGSTVTSPQVRSAYLTVHAEYGAGIEVGFTPHKGYVLESISEPPGQPGLRVGDLIVAVSGQSLALASEDEADEVLASLLQDGVELQVESGLPASEQPPAAVPVTKLMAEAAPSPESLPMFGSRLALGAWPGMCASPGAAGEADPATSELDSAQSSDSEGVMAPMCSLLPNTEDQDEERSCDPSGDASLQLACNINDVIIGRQPNMLPEDIDETNAVEAADSARLARYHCASPDINTFACISGLAAPENSSDECSPVSRRSAEGLSGLAVPENSFDDCSPTSQRSAEGLSGNWACEPSQAISLIAPLVYPDVALRHQSPDDLAKVRSFLWPQQSHSGGDCNMVAKTLEMEERLDGDAAEFVVPQFPSDSQDGAAGPNAPQLVRESHPESLGSLVPQEAPAVTQDLVKKTFLVVEKSPEVDEAVHELLVSGFACEWPSDPAPIGACPGIEQVGSEEEGVSKPGLETNVSAAACESEAGAIQAVEASALAKAEDAEVMTDSGMPPPCRLAWLQQKHMSEEPMVGAIALDDRGKGPAESPAAKSISAVLIESVVGALMGKLTLAQDAARISQAGERRPLSSFLATAGLPQDSSSFASAELPGNTDTLDSDSRLPSPTAGLPLFSSSLALAGLPGDTDTPDNECRLPLPTSGLPGFSTSLASAAVPGDADTLDNDSGPPMPTSGWPASSSPSVAVALPGNAALDSECRIPMTTAGLPGFSSSLASAGLPGDADTLDNDGGLPMTPQHSDSSGISMPEESTSFQKSSVMASPSIPAVHREPGEQMPPQPRFAGKPEAEALQSEPALSSHDWLKLASKSVPQGAIVPVQLPAQNTAGVEVGLPWNRENLVHQSPLLPHDNIIDESDHQGCKVQGLRELLCSLRLEEYVALGKQWCHEMGAANLEELAENIDDFGDAIGLKPIERQRVQKWASRTLSHGMGSTGGWGAEPDGETELSGWMPSSAGAHAEPSSMSPKGAHKGSAQPPLNSRGGGKGSGWAEVSEGDVQMSRWNSGSVTTAEGSTSVNEHESVPAGMPVYTARRVCLAMDSRGATGLGLQWCDEWGVLVESVDPLPGQPGLAAGDFIVAIDGCSLRHRTHEECDAIVAAHLRSRVILNVVTPTDPKAQHSAPSIGNLRFDGKGMPHLPRAPSQATGQKGWRLGKGGPRHGRGGYDANSMWRRSRGPVW